MLEKENIKLFQFTDNIIVYIEKPKKSTKLLEILSELNEVSINKVEIQKSTIFLHNSNEKLEIEI